MAIHIGNSGGHVAVGNEFSFVRISSKDAVLGRSAENAGWFGLFDFDASPITPNQLIALLFDYLVESSQWTGGAARSVATSHLFDRVAEPCGLSAFEAPSGFKYIGESINEEQIVIRGKDSAQRSIKGHYAEKDGILAPLLTASAVAPRSTWLGTQLNKQYLGEN